MSTKSLFITLIACFFGLNFSSAQDNYNTLVHKGNQLFEKKNYDAAAARYLEAVKLNGKDFAAHYNLANALYRSEKYPEAKAEYEKAQALAQTLNDKSAALYNLGNSYMKTNEHEKAAEYYKQALKQDPYNETIRKNYEIAKLKEKEEEQQNNQQQNNGGGGGEGENKQDSNDGEGEKQKGGEGGNQQGEDGENGNNPDPNRQENNGSNIPKDQQDAILNRVENKERETARKILNKDSYSMPQSNEKDW